jgi:putative transposase
VADQTVDGHRLRLLTVIDEFTREAIWIECARLLNSHDVVRVLDQLVESRGHPAIIKSDDGPEFVADRVQEWIKDRPIDTKYIDPESPWQNGHNESFNGVLRDGCSNRWAFVSAREAQLVVESWRREYNEERPHGVLSESTGPCRAHHRGLLRRSRAAGEEGAGHSIWSSSRHPPSIGWTCVRP